jgi:hypothetical protein
MTQPTAMSHHVHFELPARAQLAPPMVQSVGRSSSSNASLPIPSISHSPSLRPRAVEAARLTPDEAVEMHRWLRIVGTSMRADDLREWCLRYIAEHCDAFEEDEEDGDDLKNAVEYERFLRELEARVAIAVQGSDIPVTLLFVRLPAYLDLLARRPPDELTDASVREAIDSLVSLQDYGALKTAMLMAKRAMARAGGQQHAAPRLKPASCFDDIDGCLAFAKRVTAPPSPKGPGQPIQKARSVSKLPMPVCLPAARPQFERTRRIRAAACCAPRSRSPADTQGCPPTLARACPACSQGSSGAATEMVLCTQVDLDLSLDDAVRMITCYDEERRLYDTMFKSATVLEHFPGIGLGIGGRDIVVSMCVNLPFFFKLAGIDERVTLRLVVARDHPTAGQVTYITAPWDVRTGSIDTSEHSHVQLSVGVLTPLPSGGGTRYTLYRRSHHLPDWALGLLTATFCPRTMKQAVQRYKAYAGLPPGPAAASQPC